MLQPIWATLTTAGIGRGHVDCRLGARRSTGSLGQPALFHRRVACRRGDRRVRGISRAGSNLALGDVSLLGSGAGRIPSESDREPAADWPDRLLVLRRGVPFTREHRRAVRPARSHAMNRQEALTPGRLSLLGQRSHSGCSRGAHTEQYVKDLGSSFKSIRDTLVHTYGAEWLWYLRWVGSSPSSLPDFVPFPDVASIRAPWSAQEKKIRLFVGSLAAVERARARHQVSDDERPGCRGGLRPHAAACREPRELPSRAGDDDAAPTGRARAETAGHDFLFPRTGPESQLTTEPRRHEDTKARRHEDTKARRHEDATESRNGTRRCLPSHNATIASCRWIKSSQSCRSSMVCGRTGRRRSKTLSADSPTRTTGISLCPH